MTMLKIGAMVVAVSLVLTGCSTTKNWFGKRDNGSLDYQSSKKLDPIKLPIEQASGDFIPLYQTPDLGESPIKITNDSGKQFEMPKPPRVAN